MSDIIPSGINSITGQNTILGDPDQLLVRTGKISSPGSGATSEQFGNGSTATNTNAVAVGRSSSAAGEQSVAIGYNCSSGTDNSTVVGSNSTASGVLGHLVLGNNCSATNASNPSTVIGRSSSASTQLAVVIGSGCTANTGNQAIAIGRLADADGTRSIAIGGNTARATGNRSIAIGATSATIVEANATDSIAFGTSAVASGVGAIAIGTDPTSSAAASVAIGNASQATVAGAIGIGTSAQATGNLSVAIGGSSVADHLNALAVGSSAQARGDYSVALGFTARVSTDKTNSIAIGRDSFNSHLYSCVIGTGALSSSDNQLVFGGGNAATNEGFFDIVFVRPTDAGTITIHPLDGSAAGTNPFHIRGCDGNPKALILQGGSGDSAGANLDLRGGLSATVAAGKKGGDITLSTATDGAGTTLVERFRVTQDGAYEGVGITTANAPANPGTDKGRYFYNKTLNQWQFANASGSYNSIITGTVSGTVFQSGTINTYDTGLSNVPQLVGPSDQAMWVAGFGGAGPQTMQISGGVATGTNTAGANVIVATGSGTGTGAPGELLLQTSNGTLGSGTTSQGGVTRHYIPGTPKNLTNGAAQELIQLTIADKTGVGVTINYTVECTDGTDVQSYRGSFTTAAVNLGGTVTSNTNAASNDSVITTGGSTLTVAVGATNGSGIVKPKITPTSNLTPTVLRVTFTVMTDTLQSVATV